MIKGYLVKSSILTFIFFSTTVVAGGTASHSSHKLNQETEGSWQASADLVYRQKSAPVILGFLPANKHENTAGLKLEHFDLGYSLNNFSPSQAQDENASSFQLNAKIDIAWHSNSPELQQAWLQNEWMNESTKKTALKVGQYTPRIGFLNQQHHQGFLSTPLVNRTYWGEQMSEAGAELAYLIKMNDLQISQFANIIGGNHLNSKDETLAYLYQIELDVPLSDNVNATVLGNYYQASVKDRGLLLFDLTSTTHSHSNSQFSEFFDGTIEHATAGVRFDLQSNIGSWQYQVEYSQRQEDGRLYNDSANLAQLDLNTQGSYQQIYWQDHQNTWQAGVRHNYLYSDAKVGDTSDNSLDNSRLNGNGQTPQTFELMLGYHLTSKQSMQILYSDNIDWNEYEARIEMHYQIKLH